MKNLSELIGKELLLIQPGIWKQYFELKFNEEIIGTMRITGFFKSRALIKFGKEEYEIYKEKFWSRKTLIRKTGFEMSFADYEEKFFSNSGKVSITGGHTFTIKFYSFKSKYEIISDKDVPLVRFKNAISFKHKTEVSIISESEILNENPWLIFLAELIKLQRRQSSAAA
jgi:hypothetical protein